MRMDRRERAEEKDGQVMKLFISVQIFWEPCFHSKICMKVSCIGGDWYLFQCLEVVWRLMPESSPQHSLSFRNAFYRRPRASARFDSYRKWGAIPSRGLDAGLKVYYTPIHDHHDTNFSTLLDRLRRFC